MTASSFIMDVSAPPPGYPAPPVLRSEEHTSELQSHSDIVCRLLLEKKNATAVEVAAMLGDSVVGVKHCMDPRSGRISKRTWTMVGVAAACLLASAVAFALSVHTAAV